MSERYKYSYISCQSSSRFSNEAAVVFLTTFNLKPCTLAPCILNLFLLKNKPSA